jgi:capsular polysaccharide biosynthesis protein
MAPTLPFDWSRLRRAVFRYGWLCVVLALLGGVLGYAVSKTIAPSYRATATVLVEQFESAGTLSYSTALLSERLTRTFSELVKARPVLERVKADLGLSRSVDDLRNATQVAVNRDSQLVRIAVSRQDYGERERSGGSATDDRSSRGACDPVPARRSIPAG